MRALSDEDLSTESALCVRLGQRALLRTQASETPQGRLLRGCNVFARMSAVNWSKSSQ